MHAPTDRHTHTKAAGVVFTNILSKNFELRFTRVTNEAKRMLLINTAFTLIFALNITSAWFYKLHNVFPKLSFI